MKILMLSLLLSATALDVAQGERLDRRFGDDNERGYRSEREFGGRQSGFKNRDRANFLGAKRSDEDRPEIPRIDLQAPAAIGLQR